ncbi:MAG: aminotransferase class I/II-fold pyridoxal phosphate-dependent enzyme, partial [Chlamydiae bacterium]|nr:aminotransferase class I/II-fold pyridoxal phosphate-dependent enzyme [Chlamydiota bacterium]
ELVSFVRKRGAFLIYDAAYSVYIQEDAFPRTIFEIPGAKDVAIEINSFSKIVGFTGLRLSWTVVPKDLFFEDGYTVITDWNRIMTTCFNGPSIITQHGGLAALSSEGLKSIKMLVKFYMDNAMLLKDHFTRKDYTVFGGTHAPYLFLKTQNMSSWEAFDYFLHKYNIVTTPGSGFGPSGEGYLRLSAFGKRATIEEALQRLK